MVKPQVVIGQAGFKIKAYGHIISEELSDQFIRKELAAIVDIRARFCYKNNLVHYYTTTTPRVGRQTRISDIH
jgi:hypothetical protein